MHTRVSGYVLNVYNQVKNWTAEGLGCTSSTQEQSQWLREGRGWLLGRIVIIGNNLGGEASAGPGEHQGARRVSTGGQVVPMESGSVGKKVCYLSHRCQSSWVRESKTEWITSLVRGTGNSRETHTYIELVAGKSRDALVMRKRVGPSFTTVARMMWQPCTQ